MSDNIIALVDCNCFYCSCERIFRPNLKNKPVVVLSNNDGCAISMSAEAKNLGIKIGVPYFKIKELCHLYDIHIFSSNFAFYADISNRVMNTLRQLSPKIDVYSIDEAFLDITGIKNPYEFGFKTKEVLLKNIGIPVGIGIARTKVLAKVANRLAKKSQKSRGVVSLLDKRHQDIALASTDIGDIWGIGRSSAVKLRRLGIKTALDFRDYPNEKVIQSLLTKVGLQIKYELMGVSCFHLGEGNEPKEEIMCSRSFGTEVTDKEVLKMSVANYVADTAEKLRRQNSLCQQISVFARTSHFIENQETSYFHESKKLEVPTSDTFKLISEALKLVDCGFKYGERYTKAGVRLSSIYDARDFQLDFLSEGDCAKKINLMRVMDQINLKAEEFVLKSAACGVSDKAWRMKQNFKSPNFTTSWDDLPVFNE